MLLTNIKDVELYFENVEGIFIPKEYILLFHLKHIDLEAFVLPTSNWDWSLFDNRLNNEEMRFSFDDIRGEDELELPLTKRLSTRDDLVGITLRSEDGETQSFKLNWGGDSEYVNDNIQTETSVNDDLLISCVAVDRGEVKYGAFEAIRDNETLDMIREFR